jgi:P4 family phage/plasmid primase-like protien
METALDILQDYVDRIDDPKAVAKLVLYKLADQVRYYRGWGTYEWEGTKWHKISEEAPWEWSNKTTVGFIAPVIEDIIWDLDFLLSCLEPRRDTPLMMAAYEAQETLSKLLSDRKWVLNVGWEVIYRGWYNNSSVSIRRKEYDLLHTQRFLSVKNGVVDLSNGEIYRHGEKYDMFFTSVLQTEYNPTATAPNFYKALEIWSRRNTYFIEYLQWALGSALTGQKKYDNVYWLYGAPQLRKDFLLQIVIDILEDYAIVFPHTAFMIAHKNKSIIKRLNGKRMACCLDYPDGSPMDIASLKCICEYDNMELYFWRKSAEHSRYPVCSLTNCFIASSGFPKIKEDVECFWARVRPIIFPSKTQYDKLFDNNFTRTIMQEKEGILAWLVEGAKKYLADTSLENNPALQNFAMNMKEQWIEEMKKAQNKKPLPTRKGQTHNKKPTVI